MARRSIFFVLPDAFLVRSYLCTPVFERLLQLGQERDLDLVFMANMESVRQYLEDHGCYYEPIAPHPPQERWWERISMDIRVKFTHQMATQRFNQIHQFSKHRRKQKISAEMRRQYKDIIKRKDAAPWYLWFPFPRSRLLLNLVVNLNNSRFLAASSAVDEYFDRYNPVLVVAGTTQRLFVTSYIYHARRRGVPCIGGIGSWDHPTMDGPIPKGLKEYWVWNGIMRDELVAYHDVAPEDIAVTGAPQFDPYACLDAEPAKEAVRERLALSKECRVVTLAAYSPRIGFGEPSIAEHIASRIEEGGYIDSPVAFVIRSYPADETFRERFGHLERYPFVRLYETPQVRSLDPDVYIEDMAFLSGLLALSDVLVCGPGTVAIDAACLDTPVVNIRFDGNVEVPEPLSARSHFEGDHYKKLLASGGTRVASSFDELDAALRLYLAEPSVDSDGRQVIRQEFAGWIDELSAAERVLQRICRVLDYSTSTPNLQLSSRP